MARSTAPGQVRHSPLSLREYHVESRRVSVSLVFVTPLFLFHEIALHLGDSTVRNGAEQILKDLFWFLGPRAGYLQAFLLLVLLAAGYHVASRRRPILRLLAPFAVECALWALLLGPAAAALTDMLPLKLAPAGPETSLRWALLTSVGAGIYEELLFRLVLMGGLFVLLRRLLAVPSWLALALALVLSAGAFAAYHYMGPMSEPFLERTFWYRALAGILLGILFACRGLGVVVYLHAIYDVLYDLHQVPWFQG